MNLLQVGQARSSGRQLALIGPMVAALAVVVAVAGSASATLTTTYGFHDFRNRTNADVTTGETQLFVDVKEISGQPGHVDFRFYNTGPNASSITGIYFDDGTLLGISDIFNGPGVSFSQGASPGNLSGGNEIGFQTHAGFLADSDPPTEPNGVNPGEEVTIRFQLINGMGYSNVIAALGSGVDLRIGIHVQGFAGGGSESFVNNPNPVPEPSTFVVALVAGIPLGIAGLRRYRRRS